MIARACMGAMLLGLALGCGGGPTVPEDVVDRPPTAEETVLVDTLRARTESVRGRRFTRPFDVRVVSSTGMRARYALELDEDALRVEQRLLADLRLVPRDFDLGQAVLDHVAEDVVGAYSFVSRTMLLREGMFGTGARSNADVLAQLVILHEMVHALQSDPSFPDTVDEDALDWDARNAYAALLEGDAMFAMLVAYARAVGVDPVRAARNPRAFRMLAQWQMEASHLDEDALATQPAVLRLSAMAPYAHGTGFVASTYAAGGWQAVDALYTDPPASMERVMHPERTGAVAEPERFTDEALAELDGWAADQGLRHPRCERLGELGMLAFFDGVTGAITPSRAADGWSGDRACTFADPDGGRAVLWLTTWDSIRDAVEAFEAGRQVSDRTLGEMITVARVQRLVAITIGIDRVDEARFGEVLDTIAFEHLDGPDAPRARPDER